MLPPDSGRSVLRVMFIARSAACHRPAAATIHEKYAVFPARPDIISGDCASPSPQTIVTLANLDAR
jgi:hypothetical protein